MKSYYRPFPTEYPDFFISDEAMMFAEKSRCYWLLEKIAAEQSSARNKNHHHFKDLLLWKLYVDFDFDKYLIDEVPEKKVIFAHSISIDSQGEGEKP